MTDDSSLGAWAFDRDDPGAASAEPDSLGMPHLELAPVSARGDVRTMQITRGEIRDPAALLRVQGKGLFEILRIEPWPGKRTLLVLKAWAVEPA